MVDGQTVALKSFIHQMFPAALSSLGGNMSNIQQNGAEETPARLQTSPGQMCEIH